MPADFQNTVVDLRSDTVTRPTAAMLQAMLQAPLGDDVFGEDPAINALQAEAAAMFGYEAALFCPSGTMTNQIAVKAHTQPLDEVLMDKLSHIYKYEVGGYAFHSGVAIRLLDGDLGRISPEQITEFLQGGNDWEPQSRLVCIENTVNRGGGSYYTLEQMQAISKTCRKAGLLLHMDGARIFNALVAQQLSPWMLKGLFDSISVCLSKGLGAPVGSLLLGSNDFIRRCRKLRKAFGGGMRQAGILAAAGSYALQYHIQRLEQDHAHARIITAALQALPYVAEILPAPTNIIIFKIDERQCSAAEFVHRLAQQNIRVSAFGGQWVRMVTHLDISSDMVNYTTEQLKKHFSPKAHV
ncbi:MAG: aminotransferase class I/II-fold pyridoxal phosphate-dependent enzyme [Sphingobacteriales bacterium]|nr:aminotransferase class I/II-fold pyridoxal phosphate-dependent enzyme [Sphingobacteriales bacterium]